MSFAPISYILPQYENFPNYWLKAYEQGTTTPKVMATDATATTTATKYELDLNGFPVVVGGSFVIPFIDGAYDLWLFPTEAEADANDTTSATQLADNITAIAVSETNTSTKLNPLTTSAMTNDSSYSVADVGISTPTTKESSTGNGGGATYDVVLTSSVTPDGDRIIVGVADSTISFVARGLGAVGQRLYRNINDSFDSPIFEFDMAGDPDVNLWINSFSQNFFLSSGGSLLNNATSGSKDGNNNTAFGFGNFLSATTSYASSAFGFNALNKMTTGNSNTAIGYQTLLNLTTGVNNTTVGVDAGFNVTSGDYNTLIGRHVCFDGAGTIFLTGNNNTVVGTDSCLKATTLADNCIMGAFAHQEGLTSLFSVIIGAKCAQLSPTVTSCVLIGGLNNDKRSTAGSLTESVEIGFRVQENSTGDSASNVLIGTRAFYSVGVDAVSTTSHNVGIGNDVGAKVSGIQNVLVGTRCGAQATDLERNRMVCIGYRAGDLHAFDDDLWINNNQIASNALINGNFSSRILQLESQLLTLRNIPTALPASGLVWSNSGNLEIAP